ncbi:hypothetical protein BD324DRAFT_621923 [Kockovaella imperatae]|uniref:Elongator complex protein 5 n=1 Tax=Kockovaella imperatae TaxID=4999 RepID=A0A1Y1UKV3_9TREE|nr:hypothetical protein BD324DRAFT_621923 [Kockovaella imperatae]ORX38683.1 hypothetical protein BD324DRAFT_621923 [Kockovaella imperatae]
MAEHSTLEAILGGTQVPHQPLLIITDSAVFSGLAVFKESLRRALRMRGPVVLVTALHKPSLLQQQPSPEFDSANLTTVDLTGEVPGLTLDESGPSFSKRILEASKPESQIFIDAIGVLAEDYSPLEAIRLISSILTQAKSPGRLTLLLPYASTILQTLIHPSFSPTLSLLTILNPRVVEFLSKSYLQPVSSSPPFWMILERAKERRTPEQLAYNGEEGVEVGDWTRSKSGAVVQVLVRKATGGIKGISRTLASISAQNHTSNSSSREELVAGPVDSVVDIKPFAAPTSASSLGRSARVDRPAQTPTEMNLPFNLSLTDEQRRRRGQVPLPYAHEGEGADLMEYGDDEDEDDEEI